MQFTVKTPGPLMEFLMQSLHGKSRTGVKSLLAKKVVTVDGQVSTQFDFPLSEGQVVGIGKKPQGKPTALRGLKIIYEDEAVIVIDKEAGLLSVSTDLGKERTAHGLVSAYVKRRNPKTKVLVVHRLDRDTSGIMMFVKDKDLQRHLRQNWQQSIETRSYLVVVEGVVEKDSATIESFMHGTDSLRSYSSKKQEGGQKAVSRYKVLKRGKDHTLLEVELETGRKNQIRVHMQDIGHPVAGDSKYGAEGDKLGRLGLHAHVLAFTHPVTEKPLTFTSPAPAEFLKLFS
jgi:23S rRNA pseudouridine1911/1915/1917 synthase